MAYAMQLAEHRSTPLLVPHYFSALVCLPPLHCAVILNYSKLWANNREIMAIISSVVRANLRTLQQLCNQFSAPMSCDGDTDQTGLPSFMSRVPNS